MSLRSMPLLRIVLALAIGIIIQHFRPLVFNELIGILIVSLVGALFINYYKSAQCHALYGVLILMAFSALGALHLKAHKGEFDQRSLNRIELAEVRAFKASVLDHPTHKARSYQLKLFVYELIAKNKVIPVRGLVQAYADTSKVKSIVVGDILLINGTPEPLSFARNPHVFDYQQYLEFQNIYHQNFIGKNFEVIGHINGHWWRGKILTLRQKAAQYFDTHLSDLESIQVAKALVLGQREALDDRIVSSYASSGAIHVLAVSGLHIGLIYMILMTFLSRITLSLKYRKWVITLICIATLFVYALLTGLSPSVFRAFVMFSFFALAKPIKRKTNTYNVLSASALVLLLVDPYFLMSVGFQLSYLAVIGIIYIQPKLYGLFHFKWILVDKLWALTCVSIAAQLATAPLSMLYFHQFPTYFLVANLFIIPAAFVILLLGIALLIFSFSPIIAEFIGAVLNQIILWTNYLVEQVSLWPGGVINNIQLNVLETWMIYGLIYFIVLFFIQKKLKWLYFSFGCASVFSFSQMDQRFQMAKSSELSVYRIPNHQAVELRVGKSNYLLADSALKMDNESMKFYVQPNQRFHHIDDSINLVTLKRDDAQIIVFDDRRILIPKFALRAGNPISQFKWDFVISSNPRHFEFLKAREFVLTSTLQVSSQFDSSVYSIAEKGFYSKKWR